MEGGRIAQVGTAEELYRRPASTFVASFLGKANILAGKVESGSDGRAMLVTPLGALPLPAMESRASAGTVQAVVRPETIRLSAPGDRPGTGGTVIGRTYLGDKVEYDVQLGAGKIHVVRSDPPEQELFAVGQAVSVIFPEAGVHLVSEASG
jgi:iron(III) transport system ATP-binding protein